MLEDEFQLENTLVCCEASQILESDILRDDSRFPSSTLHKLLYTDPFF